MPAYYLSVDGGGTSSTFLAADASGAQLARFTVPTTSIKAAGYDGAARNLAAAVHRLTQEGLPLTDCLAGVWGLSGCDSPADAAWYRTTLAGLGAETSRHHVCNDSLLALCAAADAPATVLICGTGSIAFAVNAAGETHRVGGWDYRFSDLGSGYRMGCGLLQEFVLQVDGAAENPGENADPDPAAALIAAALDLPAAPAAGADTAALRRRLESPSAGDLATLAFRVLSHPAAASSPLCRAVVTQAAAHLARYVSACRAWLAAEDAPVVVAGGMMKIPWLLEALTTALVAASVPEGAIIHLADADPAWGGIRMAKEKLFYE